MVNLTFLEHDVLIAHKQRRIGPVTEHTTFLERHILTPMIGNEFVFAGAKMKHKFIDMHCDTISELYRKKIEGKPYSLFENDLDIDIKRLSAGGAYIQCFVMFTYLTKVDSAYEHANALTDLYYEELEKYKDHIAPVLCFADIEKNEKAGKVSALLTLEEGECCDRRQ